MSFTKIGKGSYATVWSFKCSENDVAIKLPTSWTQTFVHTVLREGLLLKNGFGIPLMGTAFSEDDDIFLGYVMPQASCTINEFYVKPSSPQLEFGDLMLKWTLEILNQLQDLHEHGFVHCDIKGKNVLIMDNTAYLCDFGLTQKATNVYHGTTRNHEVYTITHRPPELDESRTEAIATSADLWALGMTLYECFFDTIPVHQTRDGTHKVYHKRIIPETFEQRLLVFQQRFRGLTKIVKHQQAFAYLLAALLEYDPNSRRSSTYYLEYLQSYCSGADKRNEQLEYREELEQRSEQKAEQSS